MLRLILIGVVFVFMACKDSNTALQLSDGLVIENATVITPNTEGEIIQYAGTIVIDRVRILSISDYTPQIQGTFKTIDGTGKYVIPGLIDSHVHLNNIAGLNFWQRRTMPGLVKEYFERLPENFLYYGYTTLIDVDNYAPGTIELLQRTPIGPEIYTCGKKVQVMDDFEMLMNELSTSEKWNHPFLHDRYNPNTNLPDTIDLSEHTATSLVRNIKSQGNICVKTLYEDASSGLPQIWELPSPEIVKELVSESHKEGMPVIMHAPSYEGHRLALGSNVDIIAHAMWNWTADPREFMNTELPETHKALLVGIARKGIGYQPTFRTIMGEVDILNNRFLKDHDLENLYSEAYFNFLNSEDAGWARNRIRNRPKYLAKANPDFFNPIRDAFESDEQMFEALYESYKTKIERVVQVLEEHNGNLLFGTDHGAMNMYTHPPGLNGYLEMQHWVDAGISLETIFLAATYNNAKALNLLDSIGSVEVGKKANLLLLNADPLKSMEAYNDISMIISQGRALERSELLK